MCTSKRNKRADVPTGGAYSQITALVRASLSSFHRLFSHKEANQSAGENQSISKENCNRNPKELRIHEPEKPKCRLALASMTCVLIFNLYKQFSLGCLGFSHPIILWTASLPIEPGDR